MDFNQIEEIPPEFFTHTNVCESLKDLSLCANSVSHLPNEIKLLQFLETLSIAANPIDQTEYIHLAKDIFPYMKQ